MFKKSNKRKKEEIDNEEEIEVVIGDDSVLNISEVNDCMNQLRPKILLIIEKNLLYLL